MEEEKTELWCDNGLDAGVSCGGLKNKTALARELQKKSALSRKANNEKKKIFFSIYESLLKKKHKIKDGRELNGKDLITEAVVRTLENSENPTPLLKEIRETMDGKTNEEIVKEGESPVQVIQNIWMQVNNKNE